MFYDHLSGGLLRKLRLVSGAGCCLSGKLGRAPDGFGAPGGEVLLYGPPAGLRGVMFKGLN